MIPPRLEFESALASCLCQFLYAAVIDVAASVEHYFADALVHGLLADGGADLLGGLFVSAVAVKVLVHRGRGDQGNALCVVDQLGIDVFGGAEDVETRTL